MKNPRCFRILLLLALVAVSHFSNVVSRAALTVTAEENADGSAKITLSGESPLTDSIALSLATNYTISPPFLPPLSSPGGGAFPLPAGLTLATDVDAAEPLNTLLFIGSNWLIVGSGSFDPGATSISGSGSVVIPNFPFSMLTPGTFRVLASDPVDDAPEEAEGPTVSATGILPFETVYKVIPLDRTPSISAQSPGTIGASSGGKGSGLIRITNTGNVPLLGLALKERSRDFKLGKPARTSLAPGQSTTCLITFSGKSSSSVKVVISASSPDRIVAPVLASEPDVLEGITPPIGEVIPGEVVKTSVLVRGSGGARAPRHPVRLFEKKQ